MNSFPLFAELSGAVLAQVGDTQEFRIDSDGVFVQTPGTRIEINGDGVSVMRNEVGPPPAPAFFQRPQEARLAVVPLFAMMFVGLFVLLLISRASRKAAAVVAVLSVGAFALLGLTAVRVSPAPAPVVEARRAYTMSSPEWHGAGDVPMHPSPAIAPEAPRAPEAVQAVVAENAPEAVVSDVANATQPAVDAAPEASTPEGEATVHHDSLPLAKYTLYPGSSNAGVGIENPPEWILDPERDQADFMGPQTLTSGRYATADDAENELWKRVERLAGKFLASRHPQSRSWEPTTDLLKEAGVVVERCIEKSELKVITSSESMYQAHFRVQMTDPALALMEHAWRPTLTRERLLTAGGVVAAVTGLFAVLNLLLRGLSSSLWQRITGRRAVAAAVVGGLLLAGAGLLVA